MKKSFLKAAHINAGKEDLEGNNGIGRYIFLPGSEGRAREISSHFNNVSVKSHDRGHNLYLGTIDSNGKKIDVASVSTGMGCPSMEIILHELFHLGGKRFLRVGSAGTLQPGKIVGGHIINVLASVRDENTTTRYAPIELPALASLEMVCAINEAANKLHLANKVICGTVHCKSALYAREFCAGPREKENRAYLNLLTLNGVLASEMETSALFIQSQYYNHELMQQGDDPAHRVLCGALLAVLTDSDTFEETKEGQKALQDSILIALETVRLLDK